MDLLVSTDWLADELGADDLVILDATLFLPGTGRDAAEEYAQGHIPGAGFLDLPTLIDADDPRPGMVPPATLFAERVGALGVGDGSRVVLYDNSPLRSVARAWWLFRLFGARNVAILDGGMQKWLAEGRALDRETPTRAERRFTPRKDEAMVRTKPDLLANIDSSAAQVLDARGMPRFTGEEAEPRPGMASGHIPGSLCLPYGQLFNPDNTWKSADDLRALFKGAGINLNEPVIVTCGSGVTAADLLVAAWLTGKTDVTLYDGSWGEWGADPATPKATGPA
jgi:thiosulfate/3-mercaptopyruvate sulfurtransferase